MGIVQTSRSLIQDRFVRVDRRLRTDDGMGGTYQAWTTIIARYPVMIFPAEHPTRIREERGETNSDTKRTAMANPTVNGKTIMNGDRFIDAKNNECYDVVAVDRPRTTLVYSRMTRYELRVVKDDCAEAAEVS